MPHQNEPVCRCSECAGLAVGQLATAATLVAHRRPKRPNEVEGKDYFFVTREKFEEWIAQDQLLEHANVYGDYKGIPRQQVDQALAAGTDVVLRIDVQGAETVKKLMPEAISIFIAADSEASLVQRLVSRKTETMVRGTVTAGEVQLHAAGGWS